MSSNQAIHAAVRTKLAAASGVTDLVSTRIYASVAPQDATLPMLVTAVESNQPDQFLDGTSDINAVVSVTCIHALNSGNALMLLTDAVRDALDLQTVAITGSSDATAFCEEVGSPQDDEDAIGVTMMFRLRATE